MLSELNKTYFQQVFLAPNHARVEVCQVQDRYSGILMRKILGRLRNRYKTTVAFAAISPGLFATAIEYLVTGGTQGFIPIGAALGGGVISVAILELIEDDDSSRRASFQPLTPISEISSQSGVRTDGRFYSPRTIDELVAEVKGLTDIAAEGVSKRHVGHWLKIRGKVDNITEYENWVFLFVSLTNSNVRVTLDFDGNIWRERLIALNKGDEIAASGKIEAISGTLGGSIDLEECEVET